MLCSVWVQLFVGCVLPLKAACLTCMRRCTVPLALIRSITEQDRDFRLTKLIRPGKKDGLRRSREGLHEQVGQRILCCCVCLWHWGEHLQDSNECKSHIGSLVRAFTHHIRPCVPHIYVCACCNTSVHVCVFGVTVHAHIRCMPHIV